jgi:LysR family transcriptional regulator, low CO2-responsive transcriptional regulator
MSASPLERRLTLHQLRILISVADHGNFTRAAEALSLTQPAVTHQIQALARAVGHPLFQPVRGSTELTPVGRALYERACRILALVRETSEVIDDLSGLRRGSVSIAGDTTVSAYILPDALAAFRKQHQAIELNLQSVNRVRVRELLLRGQADLGVLSRLWEDDLLEAELLLDNEYRCFAAPDHPLVGRQPLTCEQLRGGPLLLREVGSGTREAADSVLERYGIKPELEMASNGALKRAVAGGMGVTILSGHAVQLELALGMLRPLEVEGFPVSRPWHVVWARERLLSPSAQAFRSFLRTADWRLTLPVQMATE